MNVGVFSGFEAPGQLSGGGIQRIEITVPTPYVKFAIDDGGRRVYDVTSLELPLERATDGIEGIDITVTAAEVHGATPNRRRGEIDVEGVGHRLACGKRTMQMSCSI